MTATPAYHVERMHRDAKIHTIFEGTSEIQQLVIARAISGLRISKELALDGPGRRRTPRRYCPGP